MSQKKKRLSKEAKKMNNKLIELSKTIKTKPQAINNNDAIKFLSQNSSIYQNSATIIIRDNPITEK